MTTPFIEPELSDYLESNVASVTSSNLKVGSFTDSPTAQVVIFNLGGETERRFRFRVMVRANDYSESMLLANSIYDELQRLHDCNLATVHVYMVTGQRPQQSGRDEEGNFLVSSDYLAEFEIL